MKITDRELLVICNLSNLQMEFADVALERNLKGEILSNHTIYSLLEKECNGLKIREDWEKKWREENPLKISPDESKRNYEAEKYKEKFSEERANRFSKGDNEDEEYGSFYSLEDDKRKTYEYWHKIDLQKSAPIIMEYFDRYNLAVDKKSHEGKFLEEWEVIYGGDFYQILLDYAFKTHQEYSKESEKCKDIEEYIEKKKIPSRKDLLNKEERIEFLNIIWDFTTALAGGNLGVVNDVKMTIESGEGTGLIKGTYEMLSQEKLGENIIADNQKKEIETFKRKKTLEFKGVIEFKVIDLE